MVLPKFVTKVWQHAQRAPDNQPQEHVHNIPQFLCTTEYIFARHHGYLLKESKTCLILVIKRRMMKISNSILAHPVDYSHPIIVDQAFKGY